MKKNNYLKVASLLVVPFAAVVMSGNTYAEGVTIPAGQPFEDQNFYQCVLNAVPGTVDEQNGPTEQQLMRVTVLDCDGSGKQDGEKITSTAGLEAMKNIEELSLGHNKISEIDISKNTVLKKAYLYSNQISEIDFSKNEKLRELHIYGNQLSEIDISNNPALTDLGVSNNQLSKIDVSNNSALIVLDIENNQISSIDLSKNLALMSLSISRNQFSKIDVSKNTALIHLFADDNQLTEIDVSNNPELKYLLVDDIFVKTAITTSKAEKLQQYDLSSLKFFKSNIPEGEGYSYNEENSILTVENPIKTKYIQVKNPEMWTGYEFKLVLYEEPEEDIKVPDTGANMEMDGGSVLSTIAVSIFVGICLFALVVALKIHSNDHYKFDK